VSVSVSLSLSDLGKDCFLWLVIFYKQNKMYGVFLGFMYIILGRHVHTFEVHNM